MNFKGHITGGLITGTVATAATFLLSTPLEMPVSPLVLGEVFLVTVFFSLFPDLDISSIPQRWCFRLLFVGLIALSYYEYYEIATLLALVAITPLLDHHRGWTHSLLAAFLFPIALAGIYEYFLMKHRLFYDWSLEHLTQHLNTHLWLIFACILGWYTHLLLDSRLPILRNPKGHH